MLDAYLRELERRARWTLASRRIDALLDDALEHLDASIQARLELGDAPGEAEREAIADYGRAKDLIQAANAVHRARFQGVFLVGTTVTGLAWAFTLLASPVLGRAFVVMMGIVFFATFAGFVECLKLRRPLAPVLGSAVAFGLFFDGLCAAWSHAEGPTVWTTPADPAHAALWAFIGAAAFLAYLLLAYRMACPVQARRVRG